MQIFNDTVFQVESLPLPGPDNKSYLVIIVKGTFEYRDGSVKIASEQIPLSYSDEFFDEITPGSVKFESDIVPFKPGTDVVLIGKAYAPEGIASSGFNVILKVGTLKKKISVIGDRYWKYGGRFKPDIPSRPEAITTIDILYENAFGGIDLKSGGYCRENFIGKGYIAKRNQESIDNSPLPNLEDPANLISSWKDKPLPVGFGFYGKGWEPRLSLMGTYDEKWRAERSPAPPDDFHFSFHNGAHPDLQGDGYLNGDEDVQLVNLTAQGSTRFSLPGIFPRFRVTPMSQVLSSGPKEIVPNLDTLCLITDENRFYMVWRGLYELKDYDMTPVGTIHVAGDVKS